jgi:hypothetical protein
VKRHEFLTELHAIFAPRSYIEIGVNDGRGLVCSTTRTIGVDPVLNIQVELSSDVQLVDATSDDFFARPDALAWFDQGTVDFTFIDGLHVFEFAFRDFINAERLSSPGSIIVLDDMLPRTVAEAARDRYTAAWTGDVFKVAAVLEAYRPDLIVIRLNTRRTGMVLVVGLDPTSRLLTEKYDEILAEYVTADPQAVPAEILQRTTAASPKKVLRSPVWAELVAARDAGASPPASLRTLLDLRGSARYVQNAAPNKPFSAAAAEKRRQSRAVRRATKKQAANGADAQAVAASRRTPGRRLLAAIRRRIR